MTLPLIHPENYKGRFSKNVPLGQKSWFACGGSADLVFEPADAEDLAAFLRHYPKDEPLMVLGGMANCIIRDGGIRGCVVRLGKWFSVIDVEDDCVLARAGALNGSVAAAAAKAGIGGLEFLSGIPGTVGGALRMNAGAYGAEVKDVLVWAMALNREGEAITYNPADMNMRYRFCGVPDDVIFVGAEFRGKIEDKDVVRTRLKEIKTKRQETQPITESTGGSTFANPTKEELAAVGLPEGMRAWELVDKVGGRGLKIGGAMMSEKHCNFMINAGEATSENLEDLGDELIQLVREKFGVELHWEIKRIGAR